LEDISLLAQLKFCVSQDKMARCIRTLNIQSACSSLSYGGDTT